jgi:hypothetical protein
MTNESGSAGSPPESLVALRAQLELLRDFRRNLHHGLTPASLLTELDNEISRLEALLPGEAHE